MVRRARFLLDQVASFVQFIGRGASLGGAAERVRSQRSQFVQFRERVGGRSPLAAGTFTDDGRLSADWLERYGALVVEELMPKAWPRATIVVDAKTFRRHSRYGAEHPVKAGYPFPSGEGAFAVLAAGVRGSRGKLRIVHIRATPDDHKGSWTDFFRSLPGRPDSILSDPDPQIGYAIAEVWPSDPPLHPLSVWHYYNKVREKFIAAHLYPKTDSLCRDAEAAFRDPQRFEAWRVQAMQTGPSALRSWLSKKGNEVAAMLENAQRPRTLGALDVFLNQRVGWPLDIGRGRIRNLRRLDIRLGLVALDQNRQLRENQLGAILKTRLGTGGRTIRRRSLDGCGYDPRWLFSPSQ